MLWCHSLNISISNQTSFSHTAKPDTTWADQRRPFSHEGKQGRCPVWDCTAPVCVWFDIIILALMTAERAVVTALSKSPWDQFLRLSQVSLCLSLSPKCLSVCSRHFLLSCRGSSNTPGTLPHSHGLMSCHDLVCNQIKWEIYTSRGSREYHTFGLGKAKSRVKPVEMS